MWVNVPMTLAMFLPSTHGPGLTGSCCICKVVGLAHGSPPSLLPSVPYSPFTYPRELTKVCKVPWHLQGWPGFLDISVINANTPLALSLRAVVVFVFTIKPSFLFLEAHSKRPFGFASYIPSKPKPERAVLTFLFTRKNIPTVFPGCSTHEKTKIV